MADALPGTGSASHRRLNANSTPTGADLANVMNPICNIHKRVVQRGLSEQVDFWGALLELVLGLAQMEQRDAGSSLAMDVFRKSLDAESEDPTAH